jgi:hydroxymethylbilane synthase
MKEQLVIGSRGSKLALTQSGMIKSAIELLAPELSVRLEIIKTSGDGSSDPLSAIGGKGVFTKELEEALFDKRIDVAVHSLKDLPTIIPEQLLIAAITKREDPRDAIVTNLKFKGKPASVRALPPNAAVGTSSPRRLAQLKHLRGDLVIKELRGNVDTRLRKLDEGQYDALILASAGLRRLGLESRISAAVPANEILPAVGQGALGIEVRADDEETIAIVSKLNHKFTRLACVAERAFLRSLGGGCQLPIAAHSVVRDKRIRLEGLVAHPTGKQILRDRISGSLDDAEQLGVELGKRLLEQGANDLLASAE